MKLNSPHYLPVSPSHFSILVLALFVIVAVIELRALRYAYLRMGLGSRGALLVLIGSLVGSYFNIPLVELPARQILTREEIPVFGMSYVVPVAVDWPGTLIAINVGGAAIPILVSLYLLATHRLWARGAIAVASVTAVCHLLAYPVPGLGIAMPALVPPVTAAVVALVLSRAEAAPLAMSAGASARSLVQTCLTSTRCRIWAPQSLRSAGPEPSTASFSRACWPYCWRAFFRRPRSGIDRVRIDEML
jgi:uncharacterized membrane protein